MLESIRLAARQVHPVEDLWHRHHPILGYPKGVIPVPEPIQGVAFFPGGYGLWRTDVSQPLPVFPVGGVMVLGHDFHSETGYLQSRARGHEAESQPTWRNLRALLGAVGIQFEECFFTNVYMGLRAGNSTTGTFPGASDESFVEHCTAFLTEQLVAQQPRLILTLGVHVPPILARLSRQLEDWLHAKGIKHLDRVGPVRRAVTFDSAPGLSSTVVALIHPSLRHASLRHREYSSLSGAAAELAMLRDGVASIRSAS
jgi:hypothetical protein